jgi:hypothetical protein
MTSLTRNKSYNVIRIIQVIVVNLVITVIKSLSIKKSLSICPKTYIYRENEDVTYPFMKGYNGSINSFMNIHKVSNHILTRRVEWFHPL